MSHGIRSSATLLDRAKAGELSDEEVRSVAEALRKGETDTDAYTLLNALGWAGDTRHVRDVERFLESPADPMLTRLAIQILFNRWGLHEQYARLLPPWIDGLPWDTESDVRDVAISAAGEAIRSGVANSDELLSKRLGIAADEEADPLTRQAGYFAILRALGREWKELPSAAREHDPAELIEAPVLAEARARLDGRTPNGSPAR